MTTARTLLDAYARQPQHGYAGHERDYSAPKAFAALRAVLDLHVAVPTEDGSAYCAADHFEYPCATVAAIETALEGK